MLKYTATMTRKVKGLNTIVGEDLIEINPQNAKTLGIANGEKLKVTSRRGSITAKAKVTDVSPEGVAYINFPFSEIYTNIITSSALDPVSETPEYKVCAVRVDRIAN